jgi:type IV secretion system protein VirB5
MVRTIGVRRGLPALVFGAVALAATPAQAMIPVIDIGAITQLFMQVQSWTEQLRGMEQQLGQLQQSYSAITGLRGMDQLLRLSDTARNYLPTDWAALQASLSGTAASYPELTAAVRAQSSANAVLTAADVARFPPALQALLAADRQAVAGGQALNRIAYARSSDRFSSLATLIDKIGATPDAKAIEELQGRIQAEQAMLSNEGLKLSSLAQVTSSDASARELARREQVVANHGNFATRFQPHPPAP